jgi:hypothetical protein
MEREQQHHEQEATRQPGGELAHLAPGTHAEGAVQLAAAAKGAGDVASTALEQDQADDEEAQGPEQDHQDEGRRGHGTVLSRNVG